MAIHDGRYNILLQWYLTPVRLAEIFPEAPDVGAGGQKVQIFSIYGHWGKTVPLLDLGIIKSKCFFKSSRSQFLRNYKMAVEILKVLQSIFHPDFQAFKHRFVKIFQRASLNVIRKFQ